MVVCLVGLDKIYTFVTIAPRMSFQLTPWRIADFSDPDPQMYADFHSGSAANLAQYSNPKLDKLTRERAAHGGQGAAYRRLLRCEPHHQS